MKKLLSIILVLVLCTSLMALTVSAEGNYAISVSSHALAEGTKTVTVSVSITANDGIGALTVNPVYDSSVLKMTGYEWSGLGWMAKGETGAAFVDSNGSTYTGGIATFTFEILSETETNVGLAVQGSTTDEQYANFSVSGGSITFVKAPCTEHAWDEGVVTKEATCTAEGVMTYTCTECGETKTEAIAKVPHTTGAWEKDNNKHWHICSVCGQKVDEANHNVTEWSKNEKEEYVGTCTVCGGEVNKGKLAPAGDITPMLTMGAVAVFCMLAAAAYVFGRKFAK